MTACARGPKFRLKSHATGIKSALGQCTDDTWFEKKTAIIRRMLGDGDLETSSFITRNATLGALFYSADRKAVASH